MELDTDDRSTSNDWTSYVTEIKMLSAGGYLIWIVDCLGVSNCLGVVGRDS